MSRRIQRVEQLIRRELALLILSGDVRDPRLAPYETWSITDVRVSPDLGEARVYVDVLDQARDPESLLAGLRSSARAIKAALASRVQLKRTPVLRFCLDEVIGRADRIEHILAEIREDEAGEHDDGSDAG